MVLPLLIALAILAGSLAFFKDDIVNAFNPKSESEKERERQDAKIRNDKGAFGNTRDFFFGDTIPKTPEELQVQKKINERGVFANLQAFIFGEDSLKPSNKPPILGSGESSEKATVKRLQLNQFENPRSRRNNVIVNTKTGRQSKSTDIIENLNELKLNSQAGQKTGDTNNLGVVGIPPSENQNNVVPKDVRTGRNTFTQTKVIKKVQPASKEEIQKATQPSENKSNVVKKSTRLRSNVSRPQRTPNNEIPVEQREDSVQVG